MVFYKSLASFGIGSATVDTKLEKKQFFPGDMVKGEVVIRGGHVEQQIEDIYLYLVVDIDKNSKKTAHVLKKYPLSQAFFIQPGEERKIPFQVKLPMETPMSTGNYPIYFKTGLDIKMAIDPTDVDKIEVFPTPQVQKLLKQIEDADFILYKIFNQYDPELKPHPFFQMFQFRPMGRYHGVVDELNVIFFVTEIDIEMDIEIIRRDIVLNSSFRQEFNNPDGILYINGEPVKADLFSKIEEMLNRKTLRMDRVVPPDEMK